MKNKIVIPGLPPMAAFALFVGGFTGQVLVVALVVFFVVGGTIELLHRILELRNAWKRRVGRRVHPCPQRERIVAP
jgi:hypothetical protein